MKRLNFLQLWIVSMLFVWMGTEGYAQRVDTVSVYSTAMKKEIKNVVILPAGYDENPQQKYPVVYLLHGYGNRYDSWLKKTKPELPQIASALHMIVVCPDGSNSWYWDSPVNPAYRYETYISRELTGYIDQQYHTKASRDGRAITGFSMGGHGGLWLGLRHPDIFGACGSMSGGVDIRPFPDSWDMKLQLGQRDEDPKRWEKYSVVSQVPYDTQHGSLAIIIDCGCDDFFYEVNQQLHQKLLELKIPHDYTIRPGAHTHAYWNNAVDYQLLFFSKRLK